MRLDYNFLRSKFARRILILFVACALLPITVLALVSFAQVTQQLNIQSHRRLRQASKAQGMAIYERLLLREAEMKAIAFRPDGDNVAMSGTFGEGLRQRFVGLVVAAADRHVPLLGSLPDPPRLSPAQKALLDDGETLILTRPGPGSRTRVLMSRAVDPRDPTQGALLGEINTEDLWRLDTLPAGTDLLVLDHDGNILGSSPETPASLRQDARRRIATSASGQFEWSRNDRESMASYWSIFMEMGFHSPNWTVVLSQSKDEVLAPAAKFKRSFSFVFLLTFWVVLLLAVTQIRRWTAPLVELREGTRKLALKQFDSRVNVTSGDEFEELAASFNAMAERLGRHFNFVITRTEIDRAILSAVDTERIVEIVLDRLPDVLSCDSIGITLLGAGTGDPARTYIRDGSREKSTWEGWIVSEEIQMLRDHPESLVMDGDTELPKYLAPLRERGIKSVLLLPLFLNRELAGTLTLGYRDPCANTEDDTDQGRQLANQVSVGLSNARLIEELDRFGWGTLMALARAIDAKSPWTAGHSERVASMALRIASLMGLPERRLEALRRGALLHDIGKIGIPLSILDKPGKLTPEETRIMRDHVKLGARILEPLPGFAEVLPIVMQHHERFDGSGYPSGIVGEAINLEARIFAVADTHDALISDRPYRSGLKHEDAIEHIRQSAGSHFDPRVVRAFLDLIEREEADAESSPVKISVDAAREGQRTSQDPK